MGPRTSGDGSRPRRSRRRRLRRNPRGGQLRTPLVSHPLVRRVGFTGSVAPGQAIGRIAAERVIPVALELGGNSPILVFADADLDAAARAAAMSVLVNSGQVCSATTRLLVERSVLGRAGTSCRRDPGRQAARRGLRPDRHFPGRTDPEDTLSGCPRDRLAVRCPVRPTPSRRRCLPPP
ncbi:aldehyde dehydrogenase family protein [Streptomyces sp. NPDC048254]|uniref:aldehyde dehydrogenase family protein n=1 Tax=Streptomyces sp. NPDC048254 TaxID=3365525 RepID=UPI003721EE91